MAAIAIMAVVVVAGLFVLYNPPPGNVLSGKSTTGIAGNSGAPCSTSNAWVPQAKAVPANGAPALTSPAIQYYTPSGNGQALDSSDSPGSGLTSGTTYTSVAAFAPANGPFMAKATATGAYDVWATFGGSLSTYGTTQYTIACVPTASNSNAYNWAQTFSLLRAPTGAASTNTTHAQALVTSSAGLTLAPSSDTEALQSVFPSTSQKWDAILLAGQSLSGFMIPTVEYGTLTNPVTNYATGQSTASGSVLFQNELIIIANTTTVQLSLDPSAPAGAILQKVQGNQITASSTIWVVSGFPGCVTGGTTTKTSLSTCVDIPIDVYQVGTPGGSVGMAFVFVDTQQPAYTLANIVNPGNTDDYLGTNGAIAGIDALITGYNVPTTGQNSGAPAVLITQSYVVNLDSN